MPLAKQLIKQQMTEVTEDEIFAYLRDHVVEFHERRGRSACEMVESHLGRRLTETYPVDRRAESDIAN